jgi:lambda repressor-like predicted transcriptional regulator
MAVRNDRLFAALTAAGESYNSLAEKAQVDPKTVQRWVQNGRVPHPRIAVAVARLLNTQPNNLWPSFGQPKAEVAPTSELVGFYAGLTEVPAVLLSGLLEAATVGIDVQGDFAQPGLVDLLADRADSGVAVRVVLPSRQYATRQTPASRVEWLERFYAPLLGYANVTLARAACPLSTVLVRGDDDMMVRSALEGCPAPAWPVMHARRLPGGGLVTAYRLAFECLFDQADLVQVAPASTLRVVA